MASSVSITYPWRLLGVGFRRFCSPNQLTRPMRIRNLAFGEGIADREIGEQTALFPIANPGGMHANKAQLLLSRMRCGIQFYPSFNGHVRKMMRVGSQLEPI